MLLHRLLLDKQGVLEKSEDLPEIVLSWEFGIDFETAKNAKLPFVGVVWGFRNKKFLEDMGADYIVNTPHDLISILNHVEY